MSQEESAAEEWTVTLTRPELELIAPHPLEQLDRINCRWLGYPPDGRESEALGPVRDRLKYFEQFLGEHAMALIGDRIVASRCSEAGDSSGLDEGMFGPGEYGQAPPARPRDAQTGGAASD